MAVKIRQPAHVLAALLNAPEDDEPETEYDRQAEFNHEGQRLEDVLAWIDRSVDAR